MPILYEAKLDGSNAVRYFHFSLVRFYLDQAHENAKKSQEESQGTKLLGFCVSGIMFSAMALEAFANEVSEDIVPKDELNDFIHLRKSYRKQNGESSIGAKYRILFQIKHDYALEKELEDEINDLATMRNNLVHYKLTELSGKFIMPPVKQTQCGDGQIMSTIDFTVQPERIEPPFIQKVSSSAAVRSFNTALSVIKKWGMLLGVKDNVPGLEEIA
jgi:hypothetical protein